MAAVTFKFRTYTDWAGTCYMQKKNVVNCEDAKLRRMMGEMVDWEVEWKTDKAKIGSEWDERKEEKEWSVTCGRMTIGGKRQ